MLWLFMKGTTVLKFILYVTVKVRRLIIFLSIHVHCVLVNKIP